MSSFGDLPYGKLLFLLPFLHHGDPSDMFRVYLLAPLCSCEIEICVSSFSCIQLFVTPWTAAHQAPLSLKFSRWWWMGLPSMSLSTGSCCRWPPTCMWMATWCFNQLTSLEASPLKPDAHACSGVPKSRTVLSTTKQTAYHGGTPSLQPARAT